VDGVQSKRNKAKRKKLQDGYAKMTHQKPLLGLMQFRFNWQGPKDWTCALRAPAIIRNRRYPDKLRCPAKRMSSPFGPLPVNELLS